MITDFPTLDCSLDVLMGKLDEAEVVDTDQEKMVISELQRQLGTVISVKIR